MQFKKIISLCKKAKKIIMVDSVAGQWIGDGQAYFCLAGFPEMSPEEIVKIFDIQKEEQSKFAILDRDDNTARLNFQDNGVAEYDVTVSQHPFVCANGEYIPAMIDGQMYLIDAKYTAVLSGCTLFARRSPDGGIYIAARHGIFLEALIFPSADPSFAFEKWIDAMHAAIHGK